jgi:hypothetical protein
MKAKVLVLALLLTVLALASEPPAWAFTCPPNDCFTVTQNCVNSGGAPVPIGTGQTCYGPPDGDQYNVNFIECRYTSTNTSTTLVCYQ